MSPASATRSVPVHKFVQGVVTTGDDCVAVEEPLEIGLSWPAKAEQAAASRSIAVTMRTPGHDEELALGFLFTEGVIASQDDVASVTTAGLNRICVSLREAPEFDTTRLDRNFYVTSSCGVCGKASLEAIRVNARFPVRGDELQITAAQLLQLPAQLRQRQELFRGTGSIHAATLFTADGLVGRVFEDVGRHNAVDKLVGDHLQAGALPLANTGMLVSGRASFELVQKARMAGCAMLAAVGAPSSLAVDLAWEFDMTLVGFLRDGRFNIYSVPSRVECGA